MSNLSNAIQYLKEKYNLINGFFCIYGSYATNTQNKNSDIDLLYIHRTDTSKLKRTSELFENIPISFYELSVKDLCVRFNENGADAIVYVDLSYDDLSHEKAILNLRHICKEVDVPVYATGNIKRVEDVKKYIYAGARAAL